jgi:hypothetical protein
MRRQKKAQPEKVALKVPPKEEVLEECAVAVWAPTQQKFSQKSAQNASAFCCYAL